LNLLKGKKDYARIAILTEGAALNQSSIADMVRIALAEDIGSGDLTAQLIDPDQHATAELRVREAAILCGVEWVNQVFAQLEGEVILSWHAQEGDWLVADQVFLSLEGQARALLTGERTALNFCQTLSGIATQTARCVQQLHGLNTRLLDTRKTLPLWREASKYAVRIGGATNHRMGLYDAFLIKENHILAQGSIQGAILAARRVDATKPVEIEVESLAELQEALDAQADIVMLDNFDLALLEQAVALNATHPNSAKLEASGNITLSTLRSVAQTGVDFISTGAITKHIQAVDLSLRFRNRD
jgi:nicotinate-nucleotide pyrophosphorylase (carboxylating)